MNQSYSRINRDESLNKTITQGTAAVTIKPMPNTEENNNNIRGLEITRYCQKKKVYICLSDISMEKKIFVIICSM